MEHPSVDVGNQLRLLVAELNRKLRAHSTVMDLTRSQSAVVSTLDRIGPTSTADLARAHGMRQQSMAAIVTALTDAGLVVGSPDPSDRRRVLLDLTGTARTALDTGRLQRADWLSHAIGSALTDDEVERLRDALGLLQRVADQP
ncbi:MarR family winged helix-turn-helix transcriptional regulator [Gordonia phthalatica]|uniref:MarR family transcriptional regulator n=1 Tax=Gordonia phthalatica TaxID=1136941 RepID=A0A0N9ND86_9ACTN|nr:MarR family winged helix-turn-helix transcriptional regulator [Gordonia phthalatica]ALG83478.1 MarR family transcriptional regulator [Gordonia phthalatica]